MIAVSGEGERMTEIDSRLSDEALSMLDRMVDSARYRFFYETERYLLDNGLPSSYRQNLFTFRFEPFASQLGLVQTTEFDQVRIR